MARVTIEDCLVQVSSRFDLVLIAAKRARQLTRGAEPKQDWDGHKSTVLALREVAEGQITASVLKEVDLPLIKPEAPTLDLLDPNADF